MKTSREKEAWIGSKKFHLSADEDYILYGGSWLPVYFDQDGDFYFFVNGKAVYFRAIWKERFVHSKN